MKKLLPAVVLLTLIGALPRSGECQANVGGIRNLMVVDQQTLEARLKPEHPRLLVALEDFDRVKSLVSQNQLAATWLEKIRKEARSTLSQAVSTYSVGSTNGMLDISRKVLKRVYSLAMVYRIDRDQRYLDRLWQELVSAAGFADWDPEHFLDTAEMTHAFAIAYDWLYDAWTPEQRALVRNAIIEKGLKPAQKAFEVKADFGWWVKSPSNWNQVCNGGVGLGALAVFDEAPELATAVLKEVLHSLPLAMAKFSPDGGCYEGTLYWGYATYYNTLLLAAMESALNCNFGLTGMPGYALTGYFPIFLTTPHGETYNFADADGTVYWTTHMFWLARKYQQPVYAWYARQTKRVHPLDLLWFSGEGQDPQGSALPLDKYFRGVETVVFRGGWNDPDAVFVGFKGGDNKSAHSHLDLGSFVLGAQNVLWGVDLGFDDYGLPGYFDEDRFDYYRLRAEGHNALVINPDGNPDQDPQASAEMIRFRSSPDLAFAVADLSKAYSRGANKVWRGVALINRRQVLVQDEIQSDSPANLWWAMHTQADIQISDDKRSVILTQGLSCLEARILTPATAAFSSQAARPAATSPHPAGQDANAGVTKLTIHLSDVKDLRLSVVLEPLSAGQEEPSPPPAVTPLVEWQ